MLQYIFDLDRKVHVMEQRYVELIALLKDRDGTPYLPLIVRQLSDLTSLMRKRHGRSKKLGNPE